MFYSVIPPEIVFEDWDDFDMDDLQEITYDNRRFVVQALADNQAQIVQLLSSDPADFLNISYQPGSIIKFSPQMETE